MQLSDIQKSAIIVPQKAEGVRTWRKYALKYDMRVDRWREKAMVPVGWRGDVECGWFFVSAAFEPGTRRLKKLETIIKQTYLFDL